MKYSDIDLYLQSLYLGFSQDSALYINIEHNVYCEDKNKETKLPDGPVSSPNE